MKTLLTYDELNAEIDKIPQYDQRLGIFKVNINNRGRRYYFENLKKNYGSIIGFGLNHYYDRTVQKYKSSKFHDEEDVCIYIHSTEFMSCEQFECSFIIKTRTFTADVSW